MKYTEKEKEEQIDGRGLSGQTSTNAKLSPNGVAVKGQSGDSQTTDSMAVVNTASSTSTTTTPAAATSSTAKPAPSVTNGHRQPEENACSDSDDDNQTNGNARDDDLPEPLTKPLADEEAEKLSNAFEKCHLSTEEKEKNSKEERKSAEIASISNTLRRMRLAEASENEDCSPQLKDCIEIHHDQILSEEELRQREEEGSRQEQEDDKGFMTRGPSGGRAVNHSSDAHYNHIAAKPFPAMAAGMSQPFSQYGNFQQCSYSSYGMPPMEQGYSRGMQAYGGKAKRGLDESEADNQPFKYTHPTDTNNLNQLSLMEDAKILNYNGLSGGRVSVRSDDNLPSLDNNLDFAPEMMRQFSSTDCNALLEMLESDPSSNQMPEDTFGQMGTFPSGKQTYCSTGTMMGGGHYPDFSPESEGYEGQDTGYVSDSQGGSPPHALSPPPSNMSCDSGISNSRSPLDGEQLAHTQGNNSPPHSSMVMSPHSPYMAASPANSCSSMGSPGMPSSTPLPQHTAGVVTSTPHFQHPPGVATAAPHMQHRTSPALVQSQTQGVPVTYHTTGSQPTSQGFSVPQPSVPSVIQNLLREPNPTAINGCSTPHAPKVAPRPVEEQEPVDCPHQYVDDNIESLIDVLDTISNDLQTNHSSKAQLSPWSVPSASPLRPIQQAASPPTAPLPTPKTSMAPQGHVSGINGVSGISGVNAVNGFRQQMAPPNKVPIQPLPKTQPSTQSVVVLPTTTTQAVTVAGRLAPVPTTSTPILVIPGPSLPSSTIVVVNAPPPPQEKRFRKIMPKIPDAPSSKPGTTPPGKMGPPTDCKTPGNRAGAARNSHTTPGENSIHVGTAAPRGQAAGAGSTAGTSEQSQKQMQMLNVARRLVAGMTKDELQYKDGDGDTYLHVAVCKADPNMVQALLERLVREGLKDMIDAQNNMRQTPLYLAVSANQASMVDLFIRYGSDVNVFAERIHSDTGEREIKGALHVAASNGEAWLPSLQALLTSNIIYLNQNNSDGLTALHCAILQHSKHRPDGTRVNSIPIIRTLVQAGADLNAQDKKSGKTPMMYALETRDMALIETLAGLVDAKRMPILMRTQAFDGNTAFRIAESVRSDFAPQDWQKLWMLLKQ